jgi:stearoyl-CoA desaturase (delta-9 desaturase)
MFVIDILLFGIPGITVFALQMIWIPFFAAGVINGIGHYFGYRNYECPDAARNVVPWGLLLAGEELHNNHHTFGSSAKFSSKWWEIDLGWFYISILRLFRLAKIKKVAPKLEIVKNKNSIDTDTLKAIIINRFQIMSQYSKTVIVPVFQEEKRKAGEKSRELFARAKSLLIREPSLIDEKSKTKLFQLLQEERTLQLVYQYRQKLQDIWHKTNASQKELIEALQDWCKQAEAAGIKALAQFANHLKMFKSVSTY